MHVRSVVFHAVSLTIGLLVGSGLEWSRAPQVSEPLPRVAKAPSPDAPACPSLVQNPQQRSSLGPLSLADIRAVVREELRTGLAAQEAQHQDLQKEVPPADEDAVERRQEKFQEASHHIQRAIGYGIWTHEDRQLLRAVLHELTVPQQDQVIGELFGAVQNGRLKVEGEGTPL
jgi:hypothetical protein